MKTIKSLELLRAVQTAYHFDVRNSECISSSDGQFTGNFWHETYEGFGIEITYYLHEDKLVGYEYDVEKNEKLRKEAMQEYLKSPAGQEQLKEFAHRVKGQK